MHIRMLGLVAAEEVHSHPADDGDGVEGVQKVEHHLHSTTAPAVHRILAVEEEHRSHAQELERRNRAAGVERRILAPHTLQTVQRGSRIRPAVAVEAEAESRSCMAGWGRGMT